MFTHQARGLAKLRQIVSRGAYPARRDERKHTRGRCRCQLVTDPPAIGMAPEHELLKAKLIG